MKPQKQNEQNRINLENLIFIYENLKEIHSSVRDQSPKLTSMCEKWLELTEEEKNLKNLHSVYKEPDYKEAIKIA